MPPDEFVNKGEQGTQSRHGARSNACSAGDLSPVARDKDKEGLKRCGTGYYCKTVFVFGSMSSVLLRATPSAAAAARVRAQGARASMEATRAWREKGGSSAPAPAREFCSAAPVAADEEDAKVLLLTFLKKDDIFS